MTTSDLIGKVLTVSNIDKLTFVSTNYYSSKFVKVMMPHIGPKVFFIGEVGSVEATNPYFDNASAIRYVDDTDVNIYKQGLFLSRVDLLACFDNDTRIEIDFPPVPGSNVYTPNQKEIKVALRLEENGVSIGFVKGNTELKLKVSTEKLLRTHFSILGKTGSGKSYFTMHILPKIQEVTKDRMRIIVFSPTGEYNDLNNKLKSVIYDKKKFAFPYTLSYLTFAYKFTQKELDILRQYFNKATIEDRISSHELAKNIQTWARSTQGVLFEIKDLPQHVESLVFKIREKDLIFSSVKFTLPTDNSLIFDLSGFTSEAQELLISLILHTVINDHKEQEGISKENRIRTLIIIEEAHNYAPSVHTTICKERIIQIAREGRKLSLNICLISQRPRHIDQTVLSQAGSFFIFNVSYPDDIKHILGVSPIYKDSMEDEMKKLNVGECLIVGDVTHFPIVCKVDFK